ncbi:MAG: MFS transporter [Clostridia bacterium]|nr:MFS transporter [Clostridia bacterium]
MDNNINKFKKTKYTCYFSYLAMSSVFSLPPLLFVTFKETYGISYTLLGTLIAVNFCTQLTIDLIFSFFSRHFNIHKCVKIMPLLTTLGLLIYALIPTFFPQAAYAGLLLGTVIFSVSAGLSEVLLSPLVAALPSDNPERDMSTLHSLYAYGVLTVVVISSLFLKIFGSGNWMYLTIFWALVPLICFVLYNIVPLPEMNLSHSANSKSKSSQKFGLALCVMCIFLGSAAENTMTNWISGFMENALKIPKAVGDILGMAAFAVLLGLTRTAYAKYGKNISTVLLGGMIGASFCYVTVGFSSNPIISIIACVLTGIFTSMLWPGTLIMMEENFPNIGVAAYALMAAGGDFGASVAPQMMGIIVDSVSASSWAAELSTTLAMTPDQIGMKTGMLISAIFPILGTFLLIYIKKYFKKRKGII